VYCYTILYYILSTSTSTSTKYIYMVYILNLQPENRLLIATIKDRTGADLII
jgi:hypothetical protein